MTRVRIALSRFGELFRRTSREAALREDIGTHIDLLASEYMARGLSADDARLAARRAFGGIDQVTATCRDQRGLPWLDVLSQDVRQAVSGLRRNPGFAAAALATLALAIGATTAVFSLLYGVMLRPLPFVEPQTLVRLWEEHPGGNTIAGQRWLSHWTFHAWTNHDQSLSQFGGYTTWSTVLRVGDEAFPAGGASLTPSLVGMIGARPALGRWFVASDAAPGAPQVVVLSHRLWQEWFGGQADVVGRTTLIDDEPVTIVGVATPDMAFPSDRSDCWRPYAVPIPAAAQPGRTFGFNAVARLAPGVTPAQVEAEGTTAARTVERPMSTNVIFGKGGPVVVHARPLAEDMAATVRPALLALAVAVALVLLVACANVANLLLSRGVARQREYAIRMAVGASRGRLVRQALTESLVLAIAAGLIGTTLAAAAVRALPAVAPRQFPRLDDVRLDTQVLIAAAVVTLLTALISGLLPAIRSAGADAIASIRGGDGGVAEGFRTRGARRMRDGLLVLESAMAVVLLVGALLVGHGLVRLMNVDAGYTPESVVTATISMPRGSKPERSAAFLDEMLARLADRPDVAAGGAATTMPMVSMTAVTSFPIVPSPGEDEVMTRSVTYVVTPGYAEAIGLRLREGRFFTPDDQRPGVRALVVNEEFVRRYLRGSALRRFERKSGNEGVVSTEIIGVVGNVLKDGHDQDVEPEIYYAHGSVPFSLSGYFSLAIRTSGDPAAVIGSFREMAASVDRGAVVERVDRLEDRVSASMAQPRFATTVLALLAALGLALASVGLFAVLSYTVSQRRREIGVRAALGAGRWRILRLVLGQGLVVTALGLALGLLLSAGLTRFLEGLLFGVTPLDTLSFVLAPVILVPIALLASLVPALRAASTDPAAVLRNE